MAGGAEKDAGAAHAARPSVVGRDDHAVPAGSYSDAVLSCCVSIYSEGDGRTVTSSPAPSKHATPLWAVVDGRWLHLASPFLFLKRQRSYLLSCTRRNGSPSPSLRLLSEPTHSHLTSSLFPLSLFFFFFVVILLRVFITEHILSLAFVFQSFSYGADRFSCHKLYSPVTNYIYSHRILKNNEGFLYISFSHSDYCLCTEKNLSKW